MTIVKENARRMLKLWQNHWKSNCQNRCSSYETHDFSPHCAFTIITNMHVLCQFTFLTLRFNLNRNRHGYSPLKGTACLTDSAVWRENALLLSESPCRNNWYPKIRFFVRSAKREAGNSATGGKHSPAACQSGKRWGSYAESGGKRDAMSSGPLS